MFIINNDKNESKIDLQFGWNDMLSKEKNRKLEKCHVWQINLPRDLFFHQMVYNIPKPKDIDEVQLHDTIIDMV